MASTEGGLVPLALFKGLPPRPLSSKDFFGNSGLKDQQNQMPLSNVLVKEPQDNDNVPLCVILFSAKMEMEIISIEC